MIVNVSHDPKAQTVDTAQFLASSMTKEYQKECCFFTKQTEPHIYKCSILHQ